MAHVEGSPQARLDLERLRLHNAGLHRRLVEVIAGLAQGSGADLVVRPVADRPGWARIEVGDARILVRTYRDADGELYWWVARVVDGPVRFGRPWPLTGQQ